MRGVVPELVAVVACDPLVKLAICSWGSLVVLGVSFMALGTWVLVPVLVGGVVLMV